MIYFHSATDFYIAGPSAVTLGKFDGIHEGHRLLMQKVCEFETAGYTSVAFALEAGRPPFLMTETEQKEAIASCHLSAMIRCPFVKEISGMEPDVFVREILQKRLNARIVAVGTDFRFGYKRSGDAAFLQKFGSENGFQTIIIPKATYKGREISSTYIREKLSEGCMEEANLMLGAPYSVSGIVLHGAHLGSRLGMPTINLIPPVEKVLPLNGVYYSKTMIGDRVIDGITNIGRKPTVDGSFTGVETYLYGISEDLYGREVTISLLHFVRPEKRFRTIGELQAQIQEDIAAGREYFS